MFSDYQSLCKCVCPVKFLQQDESEHSGSFVIRCDVKCQQTVSGPGQRLCVSLCTGLEEARALLLKRKLFLIKEWNLCR